MREVELKAVVPDVAALRTRLAAAGAQRTLAGQLIDRRYDTADGALDAEDRVLRLRVFRPADGPPRATLDRKGPTQYVDGYKVRDEESVDVDDPDAQASRLKAQAYVVTQEIERDIEVYALGDATLRIERYPRLDVLLEVEGTPAAIERAIVATGIPRAAFTTGRLLDFAAAFEARTGERAAINAHELGDRVASDAPGA